MKRKETTRDIQAQETYNKILNVSLDLVKTRGYNKVTIQEICDACGFAKGTFYTHFESKKDIFSHLATQLNENISSYFIYDDKQSAKDLYLNYSLNYMRQLESDGYSFTKNYLQMLISQTMSGDRIGLDIQKNYIYYLLDKGKTEGIFKSDIDNLEFYNLWRTTILGVLSMWSIEENNYIPITDGLMALKHILSYIEISN